MPIAVAVTRCTFANPGTYGHECGAVAIRVGVFNSAITASGVFYAGRCERHAEQHGGENTGMVRLETLDGQSNTWK